MDAKNDKIIAIGIIVEQKEKLAEFDPLIIEKVDKIVSEINSLIKLNIKRVGIGFILNSLKKYDDDLYNCLHPFKTSFSKILDSQLKDERQVAKIKNKTLQLISEYFNLYKSNRNEIEDYLKNKEFVPDEFNSICSTLYQIREEINICLDINATIPDEPETIYPDYSETSYSEKYVMLHQLGIIDYLRDILKKQPEFTYTHGNLASLITSFTGMDYKNLRRDINATYTGDKDHRNKITDRNIEKAKIKLYSLKIKPETFNIK